MGIDRSLTGLFSLQIRATVAIPLDSDRNDAADFDRRSIGREFDISLNVYGVAGGSDATDSSLGCDAPELEEEERYFHLHIFVYVRDVSEREGFDVLAREVIHGSLCF